MAPAKLRKGKREAIAMRSGKMMKRHELEALREKVSCEAVLERSGWTIDMKESTRRAVKYRDGGEIIIVTHEGRGWFNPLGDDKGDVFSLSMFLDNLDFPDAADEIASLVGISLSRPQWKSQPLSAPTASLDQRWLGRRTPSPGSDGWRYLNHARFIPAGIIRKAIGQGVLREGPFGSMWAAHLDHAGGVVGWEERGPDWRGFATGGSKTIFRLGRSDAARICVTEAAIDAMSLAAIEGMRDNTIYVSTGGGWSPSTDAVLAALAGRPGTQLIAATDANSQGNIYADRLRSIAEAASCDWQRLRPPADDWNEVLQKKEEQEERIGRKRPAACAPAASREASPGQGRPLTRPDTRLAAREGS
jgi:hypothetical protein